MLWPCQPALYFGLGFGLKQLALAMIYWVQQKISLLTLRGYFFATPCRHGHSLTSSSGGLASALNNWPHPQSQPHGSDLSLILRDLASTFNNCPCLDHSLVFPVPATASWFWFWTRPREFDPIWNHSVDRPWRCDCVAGAHDTIPPVCSWPARPCCGHSVAGPSHAISTQDRQSDTDIQPES